MKSRLFILFALCLSALIPIFAIRAAPSISTDITALRQNVLYPFFQGLAAGDLSTIRSFLDADLSKQYRRLFEQNKDYSRYLQHYYAGASFDIQDIRPSQVGYIADISITWPDGRVASLNLKLRSHNRHTTITQWQIGD